MKDGQVEEEPEGGREGLGLGIQALGLDSAVKGAKVGDIPRAGIVEEQAQGPAPPPVMAIDEEIADGSEAGGHPRLRGEDEAITMAVPGGVVAVCDPRLGESNRTPPPCG